MKETGHNSFRTSIQWSRLIPDGKGTLNQEAVDFYNRVIDELVASGIEPFMNLFHFDMPLEMQEMGGWEICEQAIYDMAMDIYHHYGNIPFYIAENGTGVEGEEKFRNASGYIEDDDRIEFIEKHLKYFHKAIEGGANCFGYHLWTFADSWSWMNSYKNRYGLVEVDINDEFKRRVKRFGCWYKALSDNNGFI